MKAAASQDSVVMKELKPLGDFEVSALRPLNGIWPVINMRLLFSKDSLFLGPVFNFE